MGLHHGGGREWRVTPEENRHLDQLARQRQEHEANRPQRFECECQFCGQPFQSLSEDSSECPSCFEGACE
jgi:hypothetical protein